MGILNLKWITESDPDLNDFRAKFVEQYKDIEVGSVHPDRGTAYHYYAYSGGYPFSISGDIRSLPS